MVALNSVLCRLRILLNASMRRLTDGSAPAQSAAAPAAPLHQHQMTTTVPAAPAAPGATAANSHGLQDSSKDPAGRCSRPHPFPRTCSSTAAATPGGNQPVPGPSSSGSSSSNTAATPACNQPAPGPSSTTAGASVSNQPAPGPSNDTTSQRSPHMRISAFAKRPPLRMSPSASQADAVAAAVRFMSACSLFEALHHSQPAPLSGSSTASNALKQLKHLHYTNRSVVSVLAGACHPYACDHPGQHTSWDCYA